jgi:hypothetical protein
LTLSSPALASGAGQEITNPLSSPAARTFRKGDEILWVVEVYNAKADKKIKEGFQLQSAIRILRDGILVRETPLSPAPFRMIEGRKDLAVRGSIATGALEPGEYVVQILMRDQNAKKTQSSWLIDFRIMPQLPGD